MLSKSFDAFFQSKGMESKLSGHSINSFNSPGAFCELNGLNDSIT